MTLHIKNTINVSLLLRTCRQGSLRPQIGSQSLNNGIGNSVTKVINCSAHAFTPVCTYSYRESLLNLAQHLELTLLISHTLRNAQDCHSHHPKAFHNEYSQWQCFSFEKDGNCNGGDHELKNKKGC